MITLRTAQYFIFFKIKKIGDYYNEESDISVKINKAVTGLTAGNLNLGTIGLIPVFNDEFRCNDDFRCIKFCRDKYHTIKGFFLNGFSVSNIRFIKK